jgi:uncharacterized protein YcbX
MTHIAGRVTAIFRYPVKSMAAEQLGSIAVDWNGLAGDRRWAFVRDGMTSSGFPWLTIRECPEMWRYRPRLSDAEQPDTSPTTVITPSGDELDVTDPALATQLAHHARVMRQKRGIFDTMPLSLITTRTVSAVGAMVRSELDIRRFRPNIVVEAFGSDDFPEDRWVGSLLRVGGMKMRVDKRDKRCVLITVDPETTQRDPEILRAVARERQGCLGVYGTTVEPGRIAIGDDVILEA